MSGHKSSKQETLTEEQFDKLKDKVFQNIIKSREEDVNETRKGFETIEKKFQEIEKIVTDLTILNDKKRKLEKYALIFFGALILFVLFIAQMIFFKEREWDLFK